MIYTLGAWSKIHISAHGIYLLSLDDECGAFSVYKIGKAFLVEHFPLPDHSAVYDHKVLWVKAANTLPRPCSSTIFPLYPNYSQLEIHMVPRTTNSESRKKSQKKKRQVLHKTLATPQQAPNQPVSPNRSALSDPKATRLKVIPNIQRKSSCSAVNSKRERERESYGE